jgi:hypothetical protein
MNLNVRSKEKKYKIYLLRIDVNGYNNGRIVIEVSNDDDKKMEKKFGVICKGEMGVR